jgi:hypothetical protein
MKSKYVCSAAHCTVTSSHYFRPQTENTISDVTMNLSLVAPDFAPIGQHHFGGDNELVIGSAERSEVK